MANEIKLFEAAPSLKNWPLPLAGGAFLLVTGVILVLLEAVAPATGGVLAVLGFGTLAYPAMRAANSTYVVTNTRILVRVRPWPRVDAEAPLLALREVRVRQTALQRQLGVGDLELETTVGPILFAGVEDPERLRERVRALK